MGETIFDFPPTLWQVQDWSFSPVAGLFLVLLLVALVASIRKPIAAASGRKVCLAWACVFWLSLLNWLATHQQASDPSRPISLGQYVFSFATLFVCVCALSFLFFRLIKSRELMEFVWATVLPAVVIFVFITLLLPSVTHPRWAARRTQCRNNLKQLGLGLHLYHDVYGSFPLAAAGVARTSWRISVLPYVEHGELYERYDQESAWDSSANIDLASQRVSVLSCPALPVGRDQNDEKQYLTAYVAATGPGTVFGGGEVSTIRSITDGTSNTLMVLEACGTDIVWTEPRDVDVAKNQISVNQGTTQLDVSDSVLSSYHAGGAQVLLADGSVSFFSKDIDLRVLKAMLTKSGGEGITGENW